MRDECFSQLFGTVGVFLQTIGIRGNLAQIVAECTTPTSHSGTCITVLQRGFTQKVKVMPNFHGKERSIGHQ